ncbi:hypothetical protein JG687_00019068 [Phytophthora cactorum]|uniref:Uncharacterized protein n=1 Tax=Phytophthora cactorum TaxID=29920 RepID=A0A8T1TNX3_9STRA|nr:hypothetical protein JG687_00019068 [Phytophthora cactorum]
MTNAKHSCRTSLAKSTHSYRSRYTQVHTNEMSQVVVLPFSFECYVTDKYNAAEAEPGANAFSKTLIHAEMSTLGTSLSN